MSPRFSMKARPARYARRTARAVSLALSLGLALGLAGPGPAQASTPVSGQITGVVSAVSATSITINGMTYQLQANSAAVQQVAQVQPGQSVTVYLNGPPGSSASKVVSIPGGKAP